MLDRRENISFFRAAPVLSKTGQLKDVSFEAALKEVKFSLRYFSADRLCHGAYSALESLS